jgi:hypothetical protein
VPYEKRQEARAAGLCWDSDARKWYAPTAEIADRIKKARQAEGGSCLPSPSGEARRPAAGSNGAAKPPQDDAQRIYFNVPFAQKDQAKALGMRFDGERKQWFAPSDAVAAKAKTTFPAQGEK